ASTDAKQQPWLSLLVGSPGFIKIPTTQKVIFDAELISSTRTDVLYKNILANPELGMLFIKHEDRARFRVNGTARTDGSKITVQVQEAYGNCPQYIQTTKLSLPQESTPLAPGTATGQRLGTEHKSWIQKADTFYVATRSPKGRMDASHRGGTPGFVEILEDGTLRIPDYPGNSMFNTLGNIHAHPRTGLLFVDFEKGETLQLTGKGKLQFDQISEDDLRKTGATGRFWTFSTEQWIHTKNQHRVDWEFLEYSPFNP
ncbi:MAG: pyridoxamine 5'-phosphate oxidase family protein, partial [Bacteroidota bacterium]